jgi:hypothetical protein
MEGIARRSFSSARDPWGTWEITRSLPLPSQLLRPFTGFGGKKRIQVSDLGQVGSLMIDRDAVRVESSCLRWIGEGIFERDNPEHHPTPSPSQLCNPLKQDCGNTCLADAANPKACKFTNKRWPSSPAQ